jgi:hypothetical protein
MLLSYTLWVWRIKQIFLWLSNYPIVKQSSVLNITLCDKWKLKKKKKYTCNVYIYMASVFNYECHNYNYMIYYYILLYDICANLRIRTLQYKVHLCPPLNVCDAFPDQFVLNVFLSSYPWLLIIQIYRLELQTFVTIWLYKSIRRYRSVKTVICHRKHITIIAVSFFPPSKRHRRRLNEIVLRCVSGTTSWKLEHVVIMYCFIRW